MAKKIQSEDGKVYVEKKPIYKRWWFITIIVLFLIGGCSSLFTSSPDDSSQSSESTSEKVTSEKTTEQKPAETSKENDVPKEYKNALRKAESYAKTMYMSKAGIYDQLTSSAGEGFTPEAAQYAIDTIQWDWNANALKKAESYQENMAMSPSAIYDQLTSSAGEKFTPEEAQYAIDNLSQ